MPPKRKANAISSVPEEQSSPKKTVRRRVKPLNESQINSLQVDTNPSSIQHAPTLNGENYTKECPQYSPKRSAVTFPRKEEEEEEEEDDQDPIALSPSRRANRAYTPVSPSKARQILDSVEILTPSKTFTAQYAVVRDTSPSRSSRHRQVQPEHRQGDLQEIAISKPPVSPTKKRATVSSPRKIGASQVENSIPNRPLSPIKHSQILPPHLIACWNAQKRAILSSLSKYTALVDSQGQDVEDVPTNTLAYEQLSKLLEGTAERGEGNSCLLVGPRGSGKTQILEQCLSNMNPPPLIIRLSGWSQLNDRAALRELATQLTQQTGTSFLPESEEDGQDEVEIPLGNPVHEEEDDDDNPFLTRPSHNPSRDAFLRSLPPPSHLPALIARIPTLSRPTVVILDAFDLFAEHPRQSLLYCLLDTAQNCRAGAGAQGLAVIGLTTRVDTINLLEKRVKSRFSGRMIRTTGPGTSDQCMTRIKDALLVPISTSAYGALEERAIKEWERIWDAAVSGFLGDKSVKDGLTDTFALSKDVRLLNRILASIVVQTTFSNPFPTVGHFMSAVAAQRTRPAFDLLHSLPYPALCLLIASAHAAISGHDTITFAQLYELFRDQLRVSTSAPVQFMGGGSIGMMKCSKEILATSFERLITSRYFIATGPPSASISKEFVRYRCAVDREDVKRALDRGKQTALQKWFNKALAQ